MRSFIFGSFLCFCTFSSVAQIIGYSQSPSGNFDNFSVSGWACEVGNSASVAVKLYVGESRELATLIAETKANKDSEQPISQRCSSEGRHRFKIVVPQSLVFSYQDKPIYIEATNGNQTHRLNGAKQYSLPSHPDTALRGFFDGISEANGAYFATGWACQINVNEPVRLTVHTVDSHNKQLELLTDKFTGVVAESAVRNICSTKNGRHRFRIRLPNDAIEYYSGKPIKVTANAAIGDIGLELASTKPIKIPTQFPSASERKPNILIFFTDDQGYADLSVQGVRSDIKTPNIDNLAVNGARFTHGYITAPQCSPSRASMITGKYQNRFSLDENQHIPMTLDVETLASKFQNAGYTTGMLGKWHLEIMNTSREWGAANYPDIVPFNVSQVPENVRLQYYPHNRGFDEMFAGYTGKYLRNIDRNGNKIEPEVLRTNQFRIDLVSEQSLSFIDKHWRSPFYLYVSHYAPHVPMEALQHYLDSFPEEMPQRRRYALAMMKAVDDGVGKVVSKLDEYNILDNTLIFFISDNGAPLGDDMTDAPINKHEAWNGSRNDPFTGEKGMLTEGGIRVPFIAHWPNQIPAGLEIDTPVSSLDAAFTSAKVAAIGDLSELDGLDLLPVINGDSSEFNDRPLFWRFYSQRAVRKGNWKYMQAGISREYLFDMSQTYPESINLINNFPEKAEELKQLYWQWANQMPRPEPLLEIPIPFAKRVDSYLPIQ